jgi:hypothetical protein
MPNLDDDSPRNNPPQPNTDVALTIATEPDVPTVTTVTPPTPSIQSSPAGDFPSGGSYSAPAARQPAPAATANQTTRNTTAYRGDVQPTPTAKPPPKPEPPKPSIIPVISDAASSDGYGTTYYTYSYEVPLKPGQTLGFALGRGYYAKGTPSAQPSTTQPRQADTAPSLPDTARLPATQPTKAGTPIPSASERRETTSSTQLHPIHPTKPRPATDVPSSAERESFKSVGVASASPGVPFAFATTIGTRSQEHTLATSVTRLGRFTLTAEAKGELTLSVGKATDMSVNLSVSPGGKSSPGSATVSIKSGDISFDDSVLYGRAMQLKHGSIGMQVVQRAYEASTGFHQAQVEDGAPHNASLTVGAETRIVSYKNLDFSVTSSVKDGKPTVEEETSVTIPLPPRNAEVIGGLLTYSVTFSLTLDPYLTRRPGFPTPQAPPASVYVPVMVAAATAAGVYVIAGMSPGIPGRLGPAAA